jgi:hypothetical protein
MSTQEPLANWGKHKPPAPKGMTLEAKQDITLKGSGISLN